METQSSEVPAEDMSRMKNMNSASVRARSLLTDELPTDPIAWDARLKSSLTEFNTVTYWMKHLAEMTTVDVLETYQPLIENFKAHLLAYSGTLSRFQMAYSELIEQAKLEASDEPEQPE